MRRSTEVQKQAFMQFVEGLYRTRFKELHPPDVRVRQTSFSFMCMTFMSGAGSSQDCEYRNVGGNRAGASALASCVTIPPVGFRPTQT